jgi:hypothetical protein
MAGRLIAFPGVTVAEPAPIRQHGPRLGRRVDPDELHRLLRNVVIR